jgi:polyisoprenoid-binding protein YceI
VRKVSLSVFLPLLLTLQSFAAETYEIDKAHSSVTFSVRHMLISNVPGRFTDVVGTIVYDEQDPSKSAVNAVIKTASINTDNVNRDNHLRNADFFDAEKYPEITFKSKRVEKRGHQWIAIGDLSIKDVTKEVELPFEFAKLQTQRGTIIGITTETRINRQEYNVAYNQLLEGGGAAVGNDVKITISLEAKPSRKAAGAAK